MDPDYFLRPSRYVFFIHTVWWAAFLLGRARLLMQGQAAAASAPRHDDGPVHAPFAAPLVRAHVVSIVGLYPALWVVTTGVPGPSAVQAAVASAVLALGALLASWALAVFRSYRLQATLEPGHELCTAGPFRWIRHPIYVAFGLLGLGTAIWTNAPAIWGIAGLLWLIADLRGRSEEHLLQQTFGERYRAYMDRTARLLPGVY